MAAYSVRLRQYITELAFKVKLELYRIMSASSEEFVTYFRTRTKEFYFTASKDNRQSPWWIEFYRYDPETNKKASSKYETMKDLDKEETIQVFSGVKKSLDDFLQKYKPEAFEFSAEDDSHRKFYDIASKKIAKDYKLETSQKGSVKHYRFTK